MSGRNDRYHYYNSGHSEGAGYHGNQSSGKSKSSGKMDFYHYTNDQGLDGIMKEGRIRQSPTGPGDAFYGEGVYGTGKDPHSYSKSELSKNNYDGMVTWQYTMDKLDYAVKVKVPKSNVERAPARNRDVLVHKGDIDLTTTPHDVIRVPPENHFTYY